MISRSGRRIKKPVIYSPEEELVDDYKEDEYDSDDDNSDIDTDDERRFFSFCVVVFGEEVEDKRVFFFER